MKAAEWIDKVKAARGWETDYKVAKELGITRNAISNFRGGRSQTMDEGTALKVAHALGIEPAGIIIDQVAERSKDEGLRTALHKAAAGLGLYIM
ncbi:MAG TPA: hypothetical protein DDX06_07685 [Curvibacter sp.]|nr:hypothetical protein [Curvibacter sp.]